MKKVLVVDDSAAFSLMLQKALLMRGEFKVDTAKNGQEALDHLKEDIPDLIMLDIEMPIMGGIEFLEEARKDSACNAIPIIVMTSNKSREIIQKAVTLGVSDYILKPTNMQTIYEKIVKIL
ncbi:MAG: response regulator [bacterium]